MTGMSCRHWRGAVWAIWVVAALLLLDVVNLTVYGLVIPLSALVIAVTVPGMVPSSRGRADRRDLLVIAALYAAVVGLFRVAFAVFTTGNAAGLFLTFGAGLLLGVAGPVVYTVWGRGQSLGDLGLRLDNWRRAAALGVSFAAVQFTLTLWGYDLPRPVDWIPLLVMSLVVGFFEAVFFRGFVQNRLEASFGTVRGVGGAAVLYGLYHVGYGMGAADIVFLVGLGVVYAVAFALARNVIAVWPLLTPLGSLFNNLQTGDIHLPWASIAGFADIAVAMAVVIWLAMRRQRRQRLSPPPAVPAPQQRTPASA
jgi:membrane protease YdiL (CAAX protease family)